LLARISGDRWLAFGAAIATVAGAAAIAVWQSKPRGGFWHLPGWLAVIALALGVMLMVSGLIKRDGGRGTSQQTQSGGDQSVNYQAGGNIHIRDRRDEDG
jgi:hypothetical protein